MAKQRSTASGTISFGLVSIPVKFYTACQAQGARFNQLTENNKRVKQFYKEEGTDKEVDRRTLRKGYEHKKNQFVVFTQAEIKALEESVKGTIEIKEFVPASTVDLLQVEKSYYLGPDKGGDKPYNLLAVAMKKTNRYAVAQWSNRGKTHLVVIRPYQDGLCIHQMFYANEVREFDSNCAKLGVSDAEVDMACQLISACAKSEYDVSKYEDTYTKKVEQAVAQKLDGKEVVVQNETKQADVCDLMEALKASLKESAA